MGGFIAQELAINYPEMVQRLILGYTGPGGSQAVLMSPERLTKFIANKGLSPEDILLKDMDIYFSEGFIRERPEKIKEFIEISRRYCQSPESFLRQFAACQKHDTFERLHRITKPTLIMTGDDDTTTGPSRKLPYPEGNDPPVPAGILPRRPPLLLYGICTFIQSKDNRFPEKRKWMKIKSRLVYWRE